MISYNQALSETLDFKKLIVRDILNEINNPIHLEKIRKKGIVKLITELPKEIQKKIYIFALKFFYREDIKNKPIYSIHNRYVGVINDMKKKVLIDNVHFLHLECNTLPENKKYIPGCQCDYCKFTPRKIKDELYDKIMKEDHKVSAFLKTISSDISDIAGFCNCVFNPSDFYEYEYKSYLEGYNFKKDGFYSHLEEDPIDSPIYFSSSFDEI